MKRILIALSLLALGGIARAADGDHGVIQRNAWSFDRSEINWYSNDEAKLAEEKAKGAIYDMAGWAEYDFEVPDARWYELWEHGGVPGWTHDLMLDGRWLLLHSVSPPDDNDKVSHACKEMNLYLSAGKHSLRLRRLAFPGCLPSSWELRPSGERPEGCARVVDLTHNVVRAKAKIPVPLCGGTSTPLVYELAVRNIVTKEVTGVGRVEFPATDTPVRKVVEIEFPSQGVFDLLAKFGQRLSRPADLKAGQFIVVDTKNPPAPSQELKTSCVVDIDCVKQTINGKLAERGVNFWEKDGETRIVNASLGKYRESSGNALSSWWALDGFSYKFDLPDNTHIYRLLVDYPDDNRRSMGFWVSDNFNEGGDHGIITTGGVESGHHYQPGNVMRTHESFLYNLNSKDLVIAILNLNHGCRAAAARIRIEQVEGPLPASVTPAEKPDGRLMGFWFEEPGRWITHFGGRNPEKDVAQRLLCMERWGQWNRYLGSNLMFPTINVYHANCYPSRVLDGFQNTAYDEMRVGALMAEKYGCAFIPDFNVAGNAWFHQHVMGIEAKEVKRPDGRTEQQLKFLSPQAEQCVLRSKDGRFGDFFTNGNTYNCLHPAVQAKYLEILGEAADDLADCDFFAGISSRLMIDWMWDGWNALPNLSWGYEDWTISQFEKDSGIKVPGKANDPNRFQQRFEFLTGSRKKEWVDWRCQRVFDYHKRLRDRIRQAKPTAKLVFNLFLGSIDLRESYSDSIPERMREIGIDPRLYQNEKGIVFLPGASYGRRLSSPVYDAQNMEPQFDAEFKGIAALGDRGILFGNHYYEVGTNLDWTKLGAKSGSNNDACVPSGLYEREIYALAMADADCAIIGSGGYGWIFGTPEIMSPLLKEYRSLPAIHFVPMQKGRDPVAVWYQEASGVKGFDDGFYFYAVNRLPHPVDVTLRLSGVKHVFEAAGDAPERRLDSRGNLTFELDPFMLKAFKAPKAAQGGVKEESLNGRLGGRKRSAAEVLQDCQAAVPRDVKRKLEPMMRFAKELRSKLELRQEAVELSDKQAKDAIALLDASLKAFDDGRYWCARSSLERLALVRVYDMVGRYPPGLLGRKEPIGFVAAPKAPELVPPSGELMGDVRGRMSSVNDLSYDRNGNLWIASPEQVMAFGPDGEYSRSLTLMASHSYQEGKGYFPILSPPWRLTADALRPLPDGRLAAMSYNSPLCFYETEHGRLMPLCYGRPGIPLSDNAHRRMAVDAKGFLYVASDAPATTGVWKYRPDGTPAYEFGIKEPSNRLHQRRVADLAVDREGRIYLLESATLIVCAPDGKELESLPNELPSEAGRIAVSMDGKQVLVSGNRSDTVAFFSREHDGKLTRKWLQRRLGAEIAAMAFGPHNALSLGFGSPRSDGAVAASYAIGDAGLAPLKTIASGLDAGHPERLLGPTQIKEFQGHLYFLSGAKLFRLTPGNPDRIEIAFDPGPLGNGVDSFAFSPGGDLYLGSGYPFATGSRGQNIYLCKAKGGSWDKPASLSGGKPLIDDSAYVPTDLEVDSQGRLILRIRNPENPGKWNSLAIACRTRDGRNENPLLIGDCDDTGNYGLHLRHDGTLYIAGGSTRAVLRVAPDGKVLWRRTFERWQGPKSLPLRQPIGITSDSNGRLWIADMAGNRILCLDAGNGKFLTSYGHFGGLDARDGLSLFNPMGIAAIKDVQGVQWLYVADVGNQRIIKLIVR